MGVITSLLRPAFLVAPARPVLHYGGKDTVVGLGTETTTSMSDFLKNCVPSLFKDYTPAWWLPTGHLQTFYCVSGDFTKHDKVVYERKLLRLTDGGTIGLDWTVGHDKLAEDTAILVVKHGLTGGSYESYVRSVVSRVCKPISEGGLGLRAVVCNFRGCAGVPITSPQFYSAGHTDDLRTALSFIRATYPKAPLIGIGFSLGASVTTHYVGQEGVHSRLSGAIVLGCPWDLAANSISLEGRFLNREIYSKAMASNLMRMFRKHVHSFRSLPDSPQKQNLIDRGVLDMVEDPRSARGMRLIDVDHILTANLGGSPRPHGPFPLKDAADYYAWGSCPKRLVDVRVPLLAINAKDDPIVHKNPLDCGLNPYVALAITKQGGHLGWFKDDGTRWVVEPAVEFISAIARSGVKPSGNEHAIRIEPDSEGFIREDAPEREHLGWRLLKDGEIIVADVDEGVGLVAGL